MRHTYLFNFYLSKIECKRPEVNTEPTHFLTPMNNGRAFSSLDGMACSCQCSDQFQFLPEHWPAKRYWISWDFKKPIYLKIILIIPGIIWSLKFKTKKNGGSVELQIPTLKKAFLKISNNSQEKTCSRVSFLIKLLDSGFRTTLDNWFCIRNQGTHFVVIMNNYLKIISVHGAPL